VLPPAVALPIVVENGLADATNEAARLAGGVDGSLRVAFREIAETEEGMEQGK